MRTKTEVVELFGSGSAAAAAMGVSRQYFHAWPENLDRKRQCWVIGAAVLDGRIRNTADLKEIRASEVA